MRYRLADLKVDWKTKLQCFTPGYVFCISNLVYWLITLFIWIISGFICLTVWTWNKQNENKENQIINHCSINSLVLHIFHFSLSLVLENSIFSLTQAIAIKTITQRSIDIQIFKILAIIIFIFFSWQWGRQEESSLFWVGGDKLWVWHCDVSWVL